MIINRLIIAYKNGAPVRLSDVANVIDSAENINQAAWMNKTPAVIMNIQRQPGANVIEVADRIKQLLPKLQQHYPAAIQCIHVNRSHQNHSRVCQRCAI